MGTWSIWHWIVVVLFLGVLLAALWPYGKILERTGYSRWWLLILFVPMINLIMIWVFAFANWPVLERKA